MLRLYYHPFASFCQKVLIALYEKDLPFEPVLIDLGDEEDRARLRAVWPMMKFPVIEDEEGRIWAESSVIVEYLDARAPHSRPLVPSDAEAALRTRMWDRFFDNFVAMNVTKVVVDRLRPEGRKDPDGVEQAKATIGAAYDLLEAEIGGRAFAAGDAFSLADCAAAPALFYAAIIVPRDRHPALDAYYRRLAERPSFRRVVEEARPYRPLLPLPWPESYD
jgi:glutathione S-transferase